MTQQTEALARANTVRLARAELRASLRGLTHLDGLARVAGVLDDPPSWAESLAVCDLLLWVRRFQAGQRDRALARAGIMWATRPVGQLTDRQRLALAAELRAAGAGPSHAHASERPREAA